MSKTKIFGTKKKPKNFTLIYDSQGHQPQFGDCFVEFDSGKSTYHTLFQEFRDLSKEIGEPAGEVPLSQTGASLVSSSISPLSSPFLSEERMSPPLSSLNLPFIPSPSHGPQGFLHYIEEEEEKKQVEAFRSFPQVSTSTIERHADSVSEPDLQSEAGGDRSEMEILGVFPTVEDLQQVAEHPAEDEPSKDTDQVKPKVGSIGLRIQSSPDGVLILPKSQHDVDGEARGFLSFSDVPLVHPPNPVHSADEAVAPPAMGRAPDPIGGAVGFLSFIKDKEGEKDDAAMKSAAQLAITGAQGFLTFIPPSPVLHSSSGMRSPPNDRKPRTPPFGAISGSSKSRESKVDLKRSAQRMKSVCSPPPATILAIVDDPEISRSAGYFSDVVELNSSKRTSIRIHRSEKGNQEGVCLKLLRSPVTMDWLFDQLCSVTTQDSELLQTFFLTYPFFTKWEDVMKGLASRWEVISESSIIICFRYWMSHYKEDWGVSNVSNFRAVIMTVLSDEKARDCVLKCGPQQFGSRKGSWGSEEEVPSLRRRKSRTLKHKCKKHYQESPKSPLAFRGHESWNSETLYSQLTYYQCHIYKKIRPREFAMWVVSKNKQNECPNLWTLIQHFNQIAYWVVSEVVVRVRLIERVELLEMFIDAASLCIEHQNFLGAKSIFTGVNHPAISRMKKTMEQLGRKATLDLKQLHRILGFERNGVVYRAMFREFEPPYIPSIGIHLKDFVYFVEGVGKDNLLMNKYHALWEMVSALEFGLSTPYQIEPISQLQKSLGSLPTLDTDALFLSSKRVDPKDHEILVMEFIQLDAEQQKKIHELTEELEDLKKTVEDQKRQIEELKHLNEEFHK